MSSRLTLRGRPLTPARVARALAARLRRTKGLRNRVVVELDLLRFRRRHGATLRPATRQEGPVALIVSLTDMVYLLKLEGMLAKALQLHGYTPVVAVAPGERFARRYGRAFGIDRFVELESYKTPAVVAAAERHARELLAGPLTVRGLKELTFRGAAVGRQVLSTISRILHHGRVDLEDARTRELVAATLPAAVASTLAAETLLDELQPALVLFNERNYSDQGPLSDVALGRGLNVVQFVSAFQDDGLVFKRYTAETRGLHPRSLSDESWERVRRMPWTDRHERVLDLEFEHRYDGTWAQSRRIQSWTRRRDPHEVLLSLGLEPSRRTAVLFSHVLWDANMFYGEDLFEDQEEWFVETVRAAAENDRVNWIVKLHPANVWKLKRDRAEGAADEVAVLNERLGPLPPHIALLRPESDVSTMSVFELADYGITIRGSVGIELPCFAVPVLTAGTGFYSGRGFTIDSRSREEYVERLLAIEATPPMSPEQVELARRHAYALFRLRPTRFTSFRSLFGQLSRIGHPLDHDLVVAVSSYDELAAAPDLRAFAEWALDSRELDYLEEPERPPADS